MKRVGRIILVLAFLGLLLGIQVSPVQATATVLTQLIMGCSYNPDGNIYRALSGYSDGASSQSISKFRTSVSCPGTLYNWRMSLSVAPGAGKTRTWTVYQNGAPTSMTISIAGASTTTNSDTTHPLTLTAGNYLQIYETPGGSTSSNESWSFVFDNTVPNQTDSNVMGMGTDASGAFYFPMQDTSLSRSTTNVVGSVMPTPGAFSNMYVYGYNTSTATPTIALYVNGNPTALTCTLSAVSSNVQTGSDTAHSVSVSAGDLVQVHSTTSGAGTIYLSWGLTFSAVTPQRSIYTGVSSASPSTAAANTMDIHPYLGNVWGAPYGMAEGAQDPGFAGATFGNLYIDITTAAGAGHSYDYSLLHGTSPTGITVNLPNTLTGSDTVNTWVLTGGSYFDSLQIQTIPHGPPTAPTYIRWGFTITVYKVPVLTTTAATTVKDTYATMNGDITLLPNGNASVEGFMYDTSSHAGTTGYAYDVHNTGSFSTGTYSCTPTTLVKNTAYYFRAYATDTNGTGYSTIELTFTTLNPQGAGSTVGMAIIGGITASHNYDTGLSAFSVTNIGAVSINILLQGTDATGGITWTLATSPGTNIYSIYGGTGSYNIEVKKTAPFNAVLTNITPGNSGTFGLEVQSPTVIGDAVTKLAEVTVLYVAY